MSEYNMFNAPPGELSSDRPEPGDYCDEDDCCECGGDGWIVDECFEDTCCCEDPEEEHDMIPCQRCNPKGIPLREASDGQRKD